jgi:dihydroneopterin aldolase
MATIALEGMRFYGYHGVYKEERILGTEYVIDVYLTTDVARAAISDKIDETVNYETVYLVCEAAMRKSSRLIENLAERITLNLKYQFRSIREMKVRVRKMHPPLGGEVESAYVEVEGDFTKTCARCGRPMLCYNDRSCWCLTADLKRSTVEHTKQQYGRNCLCRECLEFFAG